MMPPPNPGLQLPHRVMTTRISSVWATTDDTNTTAKSPSNSQSQQIIGRIQRIRANRGNRTIIQRNGYR